MDFKKIFTCAFVVLAVCAGFTSCGEEEIEPAPEAPVVNEEPAQDEPKDSVTVNPKDTLPYANAFIHWEADTTAVKAYNARLGRECVQDTTDTDEVGEYCILGYAGSKNDKEDYFWYEVDEFIGLFATIHLYDPEVASVEKLFKHLVEDLKYTIDDYYTDEVTDYTVLEFISPDGRTCALLDEDVFVRVMSTKPEKHCNAIEFYPNYPDDETRAMARSHARRRVFVVNK